MKQQVTTLQTEQEFDFLLAEVQRLNPKVIVEIGSLYGGTLWHWIQTVQPHGVVVSIDKVVEKSDFRHDEVLKTRNGLWPQWAKEREVELVLYEGSSSDRNIVNKMNVLAPAIDFLFIDGDHREDAVRKDFENYFPLVRNGGMVAFHDIDYRESDSNYGVRPLWLELKQRYSTMEIIAKTGERGIGMLLKQHKEK